MTLTCIKHHLSRIWSSILETQAEFKKKKKKKRLQKKRVPRKKSYFLAAWQIFINRIAGINHWTHDLNSKKIGNNYKTYESSV